METKSTIKPQEIRQRVLYALMLPVVRLSYVFGLSMKEAGELFQMAYYHETRRRGLKMREASQALDVSMRKIAMLSKQLKFNFAQADQEHGLPRRLEFLLWAEPMSAVKMAQALNLTEAEVVEALAVMEEAGRVARQDGRVVTWSVVRDQGRLVQDAWLARVDALHNMLGSVTNAVYGRFFAQDSRTFARTLNFRVRKEDLGQLRAMYEEHVWKTLAELDRRAKGEDGAETMDLSMVWAPSETIQDALAQELKSKQGET